MTGTMFGLMSWARGEPGIGSSTGTMLECMACGHQPLEGKMLGRMVWAKRPPDIGLEQAQCLGAWHGLEGAKHWPLKGTMLGRIAWIKRQPGIGLEQA